jgi:large subunit ribosomal protein L23
MKMFDAFKKKGATPKADKVEGTAEKTVTSVAKKVEGGNAYRVFLRPVTTEKSVRLGSQSTYVFMVRPDATKTEVAKAFQDLYGVKPVAVRTTRREGKVVRFGRTMGREKAEKKAVIVLAPGTTVAVFGA